MGWRAVTQGLSQYADQAMDWGKGLSDTLVGAFRSAEGAFRDFVKTGKVDFKGLIASILTDLAVLQFRKSVLGPIANALSSAFAGPDIGGSVTAAVSHTGGMVSLSGYTRSVPAMAFAGAPRMHAGGMAGLRPDEVPTILQRGERVLNRRETAQYGVGGGGMSRVRIELGDGLVGSIMERAGAQSVEIVQGSLQQYDRLIAPRTVARVSQDPRRSG
jgi:phage-related minor tail protein